MSNSIQGLNNDNIHIGDMNEILVVNNVKKISN